MQDAISKDRSYDKLLKELYTQNRHVIKNLSFSNDDLEDDVEWKLIGTMLFSVFCHENSQDLILILIAFVSVDL